MAKNGDFLVATDSDRSLTIQTPHDDHMQIFLTIDQAADRLGMGRTWTYERVLVGEHPSVKLGRARRIPAAAVDEFASRITSEQLGTPVPGVEIDRATD